MLIIPPEYLPIKGFPTVYFYRLEDPFTSEVVYIGRTDNPERRHYNHCKRPGMFSGNALKDLWVERLARDKAEPTMRVIDQMEDGWTLKRANRQERAIIDDYWGKGCPLFNNWGRGRDDEIARRILASEFWRTRKPFWEGYIVSRIPTPPTSPTGTTKPTSTG